jgi:hypothetical protein
MTPREIYDSLGFSYMPLKRGTKTPAVSHGIHSEKEEIDYMLRTMKDPNLAIICGKPSRDICVVDFEYEYDAWTFLNKKKFLSSTLCVRTAHGGIHTYFDCLHGAPNRQLGFGLPDHPFDLCGENGYVVAPPSVIDHSLCNTTKDTCPHMGLSQYEIISSTTNLEIISNLYELVVKRCQELNWKLPAPAASYSGMKVKLVLGNKEIPDIFIDEIRDALVSLWIPGRRYLIQTALVGWLLRLGVKEDGILSVVTFIIHDLANSIEGLKWDPRVQEKEIRTTVRSSLNGAHLYGLSFLVDLARKEGCEAEARKLLDINAEIRERIEVVTV